MCNTTSKTALSSSTAIIVIIAKQWTEVVWSSARRVWHRLDVIDDDHEELKGSRRIEIGGIG